MSKTNLQSTTHGGGRVVSVILAGTLAFGMTPAVALTTQSLEPMQAFATEVAATADNIATAVLTYTGTGQVQNGTVNIGTEGSTISLPTTADFKLAASSAADADTLTGWTLTFKNAQGTEVKTPSAAGTYTAYAVFTDTADNNATTLTNNGAATTFTISAAPASGKTDLSTAFVTLSYEGAPLSTNGFVITVPTDKTLSEMQDLYEANVVVSVDGTALTATNDYTIECTPNATATGGTMVITGAGDYENSYPAIPYTVEYEFGDGQITLGANPTYNGLPQAPTITVADPNTEVNNQPLKPTDYSVTYQLVNADGTTTDLGATKPTNAGSYNVVVTYKGSQGVQPFQIEKRAISDPTISITAPKPATYTGSAIAVPSLTIKGVYGDALNPNTQTLVAGKDYEVVAPAGGMINATAENSPYELTINGLGNYSGTTTQDFVVNKAPFSSVNALLTNADKLVFDGSSTPAATFDVTFNGVKIDSSKYDVSSTGTTTGKDVLVTLTPKSELSNFTGTKQVTVNILKSIEGAQLVSAIPTQTWGEGDWQKPSFALSYNGKELTEGTDYTVKYGENTSAGVNAGVITVTGIGEYSGTKVINYTIDGIDAEITEVVVSDEAVFNGKVQNPADFVTFKVTYEDENGVEQTLDPSKYTAVVKTNSEFKNAATYGLEISIAAGQYEAPAVTTEKITMAKANLTTLKPKATADTYLYTYKADGTTIQLAEPEFVVTLDGEPYTLVAADYTWPNTFTPATDLKTVGQYTPTIAGAGNFEGSAPVKFNVAQDISMLYVTPITAVTYNGKAQTPEFKVYSNKAAADADTAGNADIKNAVIDSQDSSKVITNYTVSWNSNTNAGTAQLVLTGHGPNYGGTKTVDFIINKAAGTMAVADIADQTYTGSAIQPEPVATITANGATVASTYAYSYANNTNAGTATVTVVPMGVGANYDVAPATVNFKINAANMSAVAYSGDTKVAVNKQPTIKLTYNGKELVAGTDFDVTETPVTSKAGKATLKVTGKGNFTGDKTIEITVEDASTPVNPDKPTTTEGWKQNSTGWWYETGEGSYVTSAWKEINGNWYHFDKSGYMQTGWQSINGAWYYLNKKGQGTEGAMKTGWFNDNGTWYYLNKKGEGTEGKMATGWKQVAGTWYYFNKSGAMQTGWQKVNGAWYYMAASGAMQTGWINLSGTWYYLNANGDMVANQWKQINGNWFYFYASGAMAANAWVGNYYVDANGYWVR